MEAIHTTIVRNCDVDKASDYLANNQPKEALDLTLALIASDSANTEYWYLMGQSLVELGRNIEALEAFNTALELNPKDVASLIEKGKLLRCQGDIKNSLATFRCAIEIDENGIEAMKEMHESILQLATLPTDQLITETQQCIAIYEKQLISDPTRIDLYYSLSHMYCTVGRGKDSVALLKDLTNILPHCNTTAFNYAMALRADGQSTEACRILEEIEKSKPDFAGKLSHCISHLKLQNHEFGVGWDYYEGRWEDPHFLTRQYVEELDALLPRWDGSKDKKLLIWAEQGIGDEVLFASILNDASQISDSVTVACDERLIPIFERSLDSKIKYVNKTNIAITGQFDAHLPMGSLPRFFRRDMEAFNQASAPFLFADENIVEKIRSNIERNIDDEIIGLSWFSNSLNSSRLGRNISLSELIDMIGTVGKRFVCLQYGEVDADIEFVRRTKKIDVLNPDDINQKEDLNNLANLIKACDRVVSIDNITVQLSGALGVPTIALLPVSPDFRWGTKSSKSFWYPSVKLVRKLPSGDWPAL